MKRFIKAVALLAVCGLIICGAAFAESSWKLAGTWNYTSNIPYQTIVLSGQQLEYKCVESGTMVMNMYNDAGTEYYRSFSCTCSGTSYVRQGGQESPQSYSESYTKDIAYAKYTPGETVVVDQTITIRGMSIDETLRLTQVEENKITGTVTLKINNQTVSGTVTATRQTGDGSSGGGGCNAGASAAMLLFCAMPVIFRKIK